MATKKDKDQIETTKTYHGITLEMNGEVIGKIKEWKPEKVKPLPTKLIAADWSEQYSKITKTVQPGAATVGLAQLSVPMSISELWNLPHPEYSSGKSTMGLSALRKLLEPGHLYIKAQLEMWGVDKTVNVCEDCLAEIIVTLEDMGYRVWFDEKSPIDKYEEACGVVVQNFKFNYVGRGKEEQSE